MGMLEREMKNLARQAGGSHKTVHDRIAMAGRFCKRLMELNIQIRYVRHLKSRHIEDYIQLRLAQGIQKQTLHNETAAIRKILVQAGRDKLTQSERISNKSLGLAAALELARLMGLRSQEAVRCCQSLHTWRETLAKNKALRSNDGRSVWRNNRKITLLLRNEYVLSDQICSEMY